MYKNSDDDGNSNNDGDGEDDREDHDQPERSELHAPHSTIFLHRRLPFVGSTSTDTVKRSPMTRGPHSLGSVEVIDKQ
jgi:hypothetical protein